MGDECKEGWCYDNCKACEGCDENGCPEDCSPKCHEWCEPCGECHMDNMALQDPCFDECGMGWCYENCMGCQGTDCAESCEKCMDCIPCQMNNQMWDDGKADQTHGGKD